MNSIWKYIVIALLGMNVVVVGITIRLAGGSDRSVPEPDYYAKALRWDDHQRQLEQNARLGWRVSWITAAPEASARRVSIQVLDASGAPLQNADVRIRIFHNADASRRLEADCPEVRPGVYAVVLPAQRSGLWTVHAEIVRGPDRFVDDRECEFAAANP